MGKRKSENTEFAYLTAFLERGYQMAQVQNITFTKQTGQFRANLHTLKRFWKWDTKLKQSLLLSKMDSLLKNRHHSRTE